MQDVTDVGSMPRLGDVPARMHAQVIRPERYGDPQTAFVGETVSTPQPGPGQVLVYVMAAGVNYNNVWAALGRPVDVVAARRKAGEVEEFHIGGSDAAGIVWAVGDGVDSVRVGDHVVAHCGMWDAADPWITAGGDPIIAPSARIWGYETNWGSFAQYTLVQAHQLLPKAPDLSWAAAAACTLVGATAYRMLCSWHPHAVAENDVVLIWGGSGGLGSQAIQIAKAKGAIPVAVTSGPERGEYCIGLGARGYIDRRDFSHWGVIPDWRDDAAFATWSAGARAFGKALWDVLGERRNPRIVFEHPGEDTIPTSIFVCDNGGMVVICAGTTGIPRCGRPALPLDASETPAGLALRQRRGMRRLQRHGHERRCRPVPVTDVRVRGGGTRASAHAREQAPDGQHVDPRRRDRSRAARLI